jgi:hypothetical protein
MNEALEVDREEITPGDATASLQFEEANHVDHPRSLYAGLLCVAVSLLDIPLTAQQAPPSADTHVSSSKAKNNYGSSAVLVVESDSTSYIQFNFSEIPVGAIVTKVSQVHDLPTVDSHARAVCLRQRCGGLRGLSIAALGVPSVFTYFVRMAMSPSTRSRFSRRNYSMERDTQQTLLPY